MSKPFLVYTLLRLLMLVGLFAVLRLVSVRVFPAFVIALLVSSVASLFLLRRQRDALTAAAIARRDAKDAEKERLRARLEDDQP